MTTVSNPEQGTKPAILLAITLVIILGILPPAVYLGFLGRAPTRSAAQALDALNNPGQTARLVDVRSEPAYQQRSISGAVSQPLESILEIQAAADLPPDLQGKTLFLVCDSGVLSAQAARHLHSLGVTAFSVRGGMQDWGRAWPQFTDSPYSRFVLEGGVQQEPFRAMPESHQAAAALAMLWVKPAYMLLSAVIVWVLLRQPASDVRILGWGLLTFLVGEVFCAINYIFLKDNSILAEYLHSYSMVAAFGLATYALLEGLDERLLHFTRADRRCAMLPVCGPCAKYQRVRCGMRRVAQLLGVAGIILAFIPLLAPYSFTAYNTLVGPFTHYYVRPVVHQWFEARYAPAIAILLTGAALLVIQLTPKATLPTTARVLFCAGAGFLGFSIFRVGLGLLFAESLVWATVWEELTELMFVLAVIYVLWVFQRTLLAEGGFWKAIKNSVAVHLPV